MPDDSYNLAELRRSIKPFKLHWFTRLRSTNDHAARMRQAKRIFAPAVVLAGHQLAGRGRGSNRWWSGTGSITMTLCLPVDEHLAPHQVPLLAGLAVQRALSDVTGLAGIRLKWPNDLLHDDLKLAGLLCERIDKIDLIGIGLNVNLDRAEIPSGLRHRVTSLMGMSGAPLNRNLLIQAIIGQVRSLLVRRDQGSFPTLLREYDRVHALLGRRVRVVEAGDNASMEGLCEGLDREGRLLIRSESKVRRIVAASVELIDHPWQAGPDS